MKVDFDNPNLFSFEDSFASISYLSKHNKRMVAGIKKEYEANRKFCREHLAPLALEMDLKFQQKPDSIAHEYLDLAVKHRRLSAFIPKFLGGTSSGHIWAMNINMEEQNAVDPSFGQVLAGHGLGLVALMMCFNFRLVDKVIEQIVQGELNNKPFLIDCAITEPGAGTDVEEEDLMPHAKLNCGAEKRDGGAVLNGRKCFISSGHIASAHLVLTSFNKKDPLRTFASFLVPNGSKGFSLGKLENKMGQKAGPASELIFEDCFVSQENIVLDSSQLHERAASIMLHAVLGITRISVGAFGTGVARGAFEKALEFAKTHKWKGKTIIQHQWAQEMLVDMLKNVHAARAVYLEGQHVLHSSEKMPLSEYVPAFMDNGVFKMIYTSSIAKKIRHAPFVQKMAIKRLASMEPAEDQRIQFYSSLAKVFGTDAGMENTHKALELMGEVGMRHSAGAEKLFRDGKLCQIYEGTNQLNRLHMFKHFIARDVPGLDVFHG